MSKVIAKGQATSIPAKDPVPHKVLSGGPLPCYVILVHGVNDVGEAYAAQEEGLCKGLNERLVRNHDLQPYRYQLPRKDRRDPVLYAPDRTFFRRIEAEDSHSPVIPFYWGYREQNRLIDKSASHKEWLDRCGNRIDKDGAKNGGAFVNAANCLPHMWAEGWQPNLKVKVGNIYGGSPTHDLKRAPDRRYQVLAALRLAMLIRIIRTRHPRIAINVVAHSMGCLVGLLAQVFLLDDGAPPADCLVLNNPPYSFDENDLDAGVYGDLNQTIRARIETLRKIVQAFHEHRATAPVWKDVRNPKKNRHLAGTLWAEGKKRSASGEVVAFEERDNRGRIYLYFSPHDRTVSLLNTQGIGWQGVPDHYRARREKPLRPPGERKREQAAAPSRTAPVWDSGAPLSWPQDDAHEYQTWPNLLQDLDASGFRQRVFLRQKRGGQLFQVGLPPQTVSLLEDGDDYPKEIVDLFVRAHLEKGTTRRITGEALSPPIPFDPGPGMLPISPIDAAVAVAHGGTHTPCVTVDDPIPPEERARQMPEDPSVPRVEEYEALRALLNRGRAPEDLIAELREVLVLGGGKLRIKYVPTPEGVRKHWQSREEEANSYHSAIVSNPRHSQAVTAYDLALARPIPWTEEESRFYRYLCEVADWRIKVEDAENPKAQPNVGDKLKSLKQTGFYENEDPKHKALIEATAWYYVKGDLPRQVDQAKTADRLGTIRFETTGQRSSGER